MVKNPFLFGIYFKTTYSHNNMCCVGNYKMKKEDRCTIYANLLSRLFDNQILNLFTLIHLLIIDPRTVAHNREK